MAFILGGDEYHINRGSRISLVCVIEKAPTPPQYAVKNAFQRDISYRTKAAASCSNSYLDQPPELSVGAACFCASALSKNPQNFFLVNVESVMGGYPLFALEEF